MWCPNSFPIEAFYYYNDIMAGRNFQCDETYLMTFITFFKIPIYNIVDNRDKFLSSLKTIGWNANSAMSTLPVKMEIHGKNILLYDILKNYLPACYMNAYTTIFPKYGENLQNVDFNKYKKILKCNKCIYTCITGNYDILYEV